VQDEIRFKRDVLREERAAGTISDTAAKNKYRTLDTRCVSAGDDLWRQPANFRSDVEDYYVGAGEDRGLSGNCTWCHVSGLWRYSEDVKAAHIVPFFLDMDKLSEILFGTQSDSPEKGGNALLMSNRIESWFDKYRLVVVSKRGTTPGNYMRKAMLLYIALAKRRI
jgi:hypothetical protein